MRRPLPPGLRVLAFEDGPFTSSGGVKAKQAVLLAVATRGSRIDRLITTWIEVDGLDATDRMVEVAYPIRRGLSAILLHGLPYAGFNIVDAHRLSRELNVPVLTVLNAKPRREAVEGALRRHFCDWQERLSLLEAAGRPTPLELSPGSAIYFQAVGVDRGWAETLIRTLTVFGKVPEPLRIARLLSGVFSPWALEEAGR
ncbi:MAG: DUF99 family protein [Candidatus Bathyarchaeia archaeon]